MVMLQPLEWPSGLYPFAPIQGWFSNVKLWLGKGFSLHLHRFPLDPWLRKEKAEKELGDGSSVL